MKRRDLLKYLQKHGCDFFREGSNHTMYINLKSRKVSAIPRHKVINKFLVNKICKDLETPKP